MTTIQLHIHTHHSHITNSVDSDHILTYHNIRSIHKDLTVPQRPSLLHHMTDMAEIGNLERFEAAVTAMTLDDSHYDVTIVCTTDDYQAEFWMSKLKKTSSSSSSSADDDGPFPLVVAVSEDWTDPSGAGNGLGTLYAWQKACLYAQEHYQVDLATQLSDGSISAALYHTAGKGTRMAPLPASENNNKPGVVRHPYMYFVV